VVVNNVAVVVVFAVIVGYVLVVGLVPIDS
jgi:hypothetical protein